MPIFTYQAKNKQGQAIKGRIEAAARDVAAEILFKRGLTVLSLKVVKEYSLVFLTARVKSEDKVAFLRQLAVMSSATIPLVHALRILAKQTTNRYLQTAAEELAEDVNAGSRLSDAMARFPKVFSSFYINMVKAGEVAGKLDETLGYLADQQEKDHDLISRIRGAMIYPAFILGGLAAVGFIMMAFVVPKITGLVQDLGADLPLATRILIAVSGFFNNFWYLIILALLGLIIFVQFYKKTKRGREFWDLLKIKLPIFGIFFQKIYLIRFCRNISTLIASGVHLTQALNICADVVGNEVYKRLILETMKEVEDGHSVASVFSKSKAVPPMVHQMMAVGEQTGRLDSILEKLADFYTREIDVMVNNLVSLIEPLIILVLGVAVGGMVAAIILPIFNLASQF